MRVPQLREKYAADFANRMAELHGNTASEYQHARARQFFDDELFNTLNTAGYEAFFIFETGSTAWGTDKPESDIDLTVIGRDLVLDVFSYPRSEGASKIEITLDQVSFVADVRFFSLERILRLGFQSKLTAVELTAGNLLQKETTVGALSLMNALEHYYDPKAFAKSLSGNLFSFTDANAEKKRKVRDDAKTRRRALRYICYLMQILAGRVERPEMNVQRWYNEIATTYQKQRFQDAGLWAEGRATKPFHDFDAWIETAENFIDAMPVAEGLHPINPAVANEAMESIYFEVNP